MRKFREKILDLINALTIAPKNLRICTILISIYQVLIAHVVLFLVLLGLSHAEEMNALLKVDIADQNEREDYVSSNHEKFKTASELASITLLCLYVATATASVYLISCLLLLMGSLRNRPELMIFWLIFNLIGFLLTIALMTSLSSGYGVVEFVGGPLSYWFFCSAILIFDIFLWFVVHAYYLTLCKMKKLKEIAVVPIPCPSPDALPKIPYYYRKENIKMGDNGYKHLLTDNLDQQNYII